MTLTENDIDHLLIDLSGKDEEQREKAERFFQENKAEILPHVVARFDQSLGRKIKIQKEQKHFLQVRVIAYFVIVTFGLLVNQFWFAALVVFLLPLMYVSAYWITRRFSRLWELDAKYASMLRIIAGLDSPRYVGSMIDLMIEGNTHAVAIVEPVLYRQLKLLRPSHASILATKHYNYLHKRLIYYGCLQVSTFDEDKALAILKVLEQTGDAEAIPFVERVANKGGTMLVRIAARECFEYLREYGRGVSAKDTLLRASHDTGELNELLYVPNHEVENQAETLLRVPNEEKE